MGYEIPDVIVDGEVVEVDEPFQLKTTWRMLMDPGTAAEGFSTITYDIKEYDGGVCSLTVTHELEGMPTLAAMVAGNTEDPYMGGGGHPWIFSDLKSVLESGRRMAGAAGEGPRRLPGRGGPGSVNRRTRRGCGR